MHSRTLIAKTLLAVGGLLAGALFLELGLRAVLLFQKPAAEPRSDRPAFYYTGRGTESFQNDSFERSKPPGVFRVAVVGDSFTFPQFLHLDDAYTRRLQRLLNLNDSDLQAEVLNFGRPGMSAVQEIELVKDALSHEPDLLLLEITLNDAHGNTTCALKKLGKLHLIRPLKISSENHPLLFHSKLASLAAERIHNQRSRRLFVDFTLSAYRDEERIRAFRTAVRRMQRLARQAEVPFAAFVMPFFHYPLDEQYPFHSVHTQINALLEQRKIPHLDMFSAFRGIPHSNLHVVLGSDMHPNEVAHRIVAERLYLWLEQHDLLPAQLLLAKKWPDQVGNRRRTRFHCP